MELLYEKIEISSKAEKNNFIHPTVPAQQGIVKAELAELSAKIDHLAVQIGFNNQDYLDLKNKLGFEFPINKVKVLSKFETKLDKNASYRELTVCKKIYKFILKAHFN